MRHLTASQKIAQLESRIARLEKQASLRRGLDREEETVLDEVIHHYRLRPRDYEDVEISIEDQVGRGEDRIVLYEVSLFKEDGDSFTCYVLYDAYEELVEGFYDYQDDYEAQRAFDSLVERHA
jgi:hypothetical protein